MFQKTISGISTAPSSFARISTTGLSENPDSQESTQASEEMKKRFPFKMACFNTDNGSENEKEFFEGLQKENIFHFYSNAGTPTDNPSLKDLF